MGAYMEKAGIPSFFLHTFQLPASVSWMEREMLSLSFLEEFAEQERLEKRGFFEKNGEGSR